MIPAAPRHFPTLAGRECGRCSLCCKVLAVEELAKACGTWCGHVSKASGCTIYADRPEACRAFTCGYLHWSRAGERWHPARAKMVIAPELDGGRIAIHVDANTPNVWKAAPYYADLKAWARIGGRDLMQVCVVHAGNRLTAILPDRDVDVGLVTEDEVVFYERQPSGAINVLKLKKSDPMLAT